MDLRKFRLEISALQLPYKLEHTSADFLLLTGNQHSFSWVWGKTGNPDSCPGDSSENRPREQSAGGGGVDNPRGPRCNPLGC